MKNYKEIKLEDLKRNISLDLDFKTTKDLMPFCGIIGQERAVKAIQAAMEIKLKGFNLYVSGNTGIGKTGYVLSVIRKLAKEEKIPSDFCYIHNFDDPSNPIYVELDAGYGFELKTDMNQFISKLIKLFKNTLSGENYEKQKKDILKRFDLMKTKLLAEFEKQTYDQGFKLNYNKDGITFSPVFNGNVITEKDFNNLNEKDKKYFKDKSPSIQEETFKILAKLTEIDNNSQKSIKEWEENLATFISVECLKDLKVKYKGNNILQNFFYSIQSDIVNKLDFFKKYIEYLKKNDASDDSLNVVTSPLNNYKVNLIIDNSNSLTAPVIVAKNSNYFDLFGKLEFEQSPQGMKTNHLLLKPGLLHKANGGYLIINIKDILSYQPSWEALKRAIRNSEITIDASRDLPSPNVPIATIKPNGIPLNINFVLIGNEQIYMQLCKVDPDFKKLFKFKAEFDNTSPRTQENITLLARYIAYVVFINKLNPFNKDAVNQVIEYSSKMCGDINKITSNMSDISDLVIEASHITSKLNKKTVTEKEVIKAFSNKKERYSQFDNILNCMIKQGDIMISTEGEKIGQINGLTIINNGDFSFGKPVRITANTFLGKNGIINIEREVSMSGNSHSKGVLILSAYIGEKFAQNFPLSFNASICFEQLYNGVDGDSASSTELYAILSSLAEVPIKQNLAVTGSVNQKGEIQPIGGVSEKIEGFFNVCKIKGLNDNGVLIPKQNIENLNLNNEILDAIDKGNFHIYPISTIDEGITILTGVKAGKLITNGSYESNSIYAKVYDKLKRYAENAKKFN